VSASEPVTLLLEVLAEVRALRASIGELRAALPDRRAPDAKGEALLRAIYEHAGGRPFSVTELMRHAAVLVGAAELQEVIKGMNGKRLGRALRRLRDRELGGFVLYREGEDSGGAIWRVSRAKTPESLGLRARAIRRA
jgi:hypothetical protein